MRRDESRWHGELITTVKQQIRDDLAQALQASDHWARLSYLHQKIAQLAEDETPLGQLQRFVYVMNALVTGQRHHCLKPTQVRQLATLATAILQAQGVKPRASRLSFLYSELHTVLSQIHRQNGQQWAAAWEQNYANYVGQGRTGGEAGFEALGVANRALRLGHVKLALASFLQAEALGLSPANFAKARLGRIKTLRLSGALAAAADVVRASRGDERLSGPSARELEWESLCTQAQAEGELGRLRAAVGRGGSHREATYMVETMLWLASSAATDGWRRLPKLRYLMRLPEYKPQRLGLFFKIALQIERCYVFESPLPVRLSQLGTLLASASRLVSIDKELLAWSASARWLARSKSFTLASLALNEYEALSLRLTSGGERDVLGLLGDLYSKDWYTGAPESAPLEDDSDAA